MELKLVYRGLRQVSDWALRFYSDIYVDGQENVPHDGPLIIASCHHNEILDIATLSITIPHRRPVCFWAKSTMFKNPLVRAVLLSSGSIPVARNPNSTPVPTEHPARAGPAASQSSLNEALFRETFRALEREEVIGVFPEGTSYTEPCIAQVKDGASRAALGYVKWANERKGKHKGKKLLIVPVGIVYTDKSQYQSRLCVRFGKAIDVETFAAEKMNAPVAESELQLDSREVIRALSAEIEKHLLDLTINAPNWDTLYTVRTARDILWADEEIPASHFVSISQNLVDLFADPKAAASCAKARHSLLRYHCLLNYTNISHSSLNAIYPAPPSLAAPYPSGLRALSIVLRQLLISVLHPRFALFLPTLVLHVPAYVTGLLADRLLGNPEEEETHAQFKAVLGGLAASAAYAAVTRAIVRGILKGSINVFRIADVKVPEILLNARWLFAGGTHGGGVAGKARAALGVFGIFYATSFVFSRWHNYWVGANYRQLKRLLTSLKLFVGSVAPRSSALAGTPEQKDRISTPKAPSVSSHRLIRPLLDARTEATRNMWSFMVDSKYLHGLVTARMKGEASMQVGPAKRYSL
ncbi:glycerol-3-phosphate-1-acyltransferase [Daedaleopsis nitida]|nr:glycerol-3-phosphate-1-acyltransferase [Daedaleopsis nitida]